MTAEAFVAAFGAVHAAGARVVLALRALQLAHPLRARWLPALVPTRPTPTHCYLPVTDGS